MSVYELNSTQTGQELNSTQTGQIVLSKAHFRAYKTASNQRQIHLQ